MTATCEENTRHGLVLFFKHVYEECSNFHRVRYSGPRDFVRDRSSPATRAHAAAGRVWGKNGGRSGHTFASVARRAAPYVQEVELEFQILDFGLSLPSFGVGLPTPRPLLFPLLLPSLPLLNLCFLSPPRNAHPVCAGGHRGELYGTVDDRLTAHQGGVMSCPDWVPDSMWLAFSAGRLSIRGRHQGSGRSQAAVDAQKEGGTGGKRAGACHGCTEKGVI